MIEDQEEREKVSQHVTHGDKTCKLLVERLNLNCCTTTCGVVLPHSLITIIYFIKLSRSVGRCPSKHSTHTIYVYHITHHPPVSWTVSPGSPHSLPRCMPSQRMCTSKTVAMETPCTAKRQGVWL